MSSSRRETMKHSELVTQLNQQLNREVSALLRYMLRAAALQAAEDEAVRAMYLKRVADATQHVQFLADQIVLLDGTPALQPDLFFPTATARGSLRRDAADEQTDEKSYLRLASEAGKEMLPT